MSLSVERAGIFKIFFSCHYDFSAEVYILRHLGIEVLLSLFHESAESLPVFFRGNLKVVVCDYGYNHGAIAINSGGSREVVLECERVGVVWIVGCA